MKKEVLVFIFDGYADWESAYVCSELNAPKTGYTIKTLSLDKKPKTSMGGICVLPDYSVDDFPADFSMLILIGGYAWMEQRNNAVLPLVEYALKKRIPIGAICNAANFMAENGYLDQIRHSGNTLEFMKVQAPHYKGDQNFIEKQAVCDSSIITANGTATLEFAKEILLLLKAKPETEVLNWYNENKSGFYPA
ncbi:putative intracellular protease/amidase [Sporomusaceae bacterium BoRhaA]|uniref:type 1 glutamine amidotransferase family protein n=1 Tax=Pelorhabdus rhamnosifermentans TaxID=2772457 RepID=UPI001C061879|nr:type 1 glutamine amidotransferase family protein [Pelorhabdus rhamnosifermentans]MBU2700094.1 putative intracellular protease/amidase [Pelorhabdus rhamnosifermentans]